MYVSTGTYLCTYVQWRAHGVHSQMHVHVPLVAFMCAQQARAMYQCPQAHLLVLLM